MSDPMSELDDRLVEEAEANLFAAMLLIPENFLIADLEEMGIRAVDYEDDTLISELAERYGVSKQLMTMRMANLVLEF